MAKKYFRTIYNPWTYEMDLKTPKKKCGIPERYKNLSKEVKIGDIFINYMLGVSRFVGLSEASSKMQLSEKSIYYEDDPYKLQCDVKNVIMLPLENTIPIFEDIIWDSLSITKGLERSNKKWSGSFMGSIARLKDIDGQLLENILIQQQANPVIYPLTNSEKIRYKWHTKQHIDKNHHSIDEKNNNEENISEETKKMSNTNQVKWTNAMNKYVFKRLFEIMGPLSLYANKKGSTAAEAKAFIIIAKELTYLFSQDITDDKVSMLVYKISWAPILNPRISMILTLAAAIESGWLKNEDLLRLEKHYIKKGLMMDLGNYIAVKKI